MSGSPEPLTSQGVGHPAAFQGAKGYSLTRAGGELADTWKYTVTRFMVSGHHLPRSTTSGKPEVIALLLAPAFIRMLRIGIAGQLMSMKSSGSSTRTP